MWAFHTAVFYLVSIAFYFSFPTEAASRAIVQFLEINQSEEASRGWMLLTTINLLASSGQVSFHQQTEKQRKESQYYIVQRTPG